jgi:hypothetical protein
MTFARRILLNAQKPGECSFVSQDNLEKIKGIASQEKVVRNRPHPNVNENVIEIHPCTEDGKVTLETQLKSMVNMDDLFSDFFDQYHLCDALKNVEMFDRMNCSPKMGYAYIELGGKRAHIFKTGKIIMRKADDREDALGTLTRFSRLTLPARICACGNILADCFAGACHQCYVDSCAALMEDLGVGKDDGRTTIGELLKEHNGGTSLAQNFERLTSMVGEIRKIDDALGKDIDDYGKKIDDILSKVKKTCIGNILENKDPKSTIVALAQYGLARDLKRVRDSLLSLGEENDKLREDAMNILFDAYDAFNGRDEKDMKAIWKRYEEYMSKLELNPSTVGAAKIATNGFYISRILGKAVMMKVDEN